MTRTERHRADLEFVRRTLAGRASAVDEFARRMQCVPRFLAARNRRRGGPFDADELADLVQDTITAIWNKLESYRGLAALETWAYRFCAHKLDNALSKKARRAPVLVGDDETGVLDQAQAGAPVYDHLYLGLDTLGPPPCEVIRMRHFDDLSFAEIAARMDVPVDTAKSWYYRGLRSLRDILQRQGTEGPG